MFKSITSFLDADIAERVKGNATSRQADFIVIIRSLDHPMFWKCLDYSFSLPFVYI